MATLASLLSPDYGYVVVMAAAIALEVPLTGFLVVSAARRRVFNKDFFAKLTASGIVEEHKKATGSDKISLAAYPDTGSGRYSALLSYSSWLDFNNAQRAHLNFTEGAATALTGLLLCGLFYPRFAAASGLAYFIGRVLYPWGYVTQSFSIRMGGTLLIDVALLAQLGAATYGGWCLAGGLGGLLKFAA